MPDDASLTTAELTTANFADFVAVLGGPTGGCGGCWCTWWRLPRSEWQRAAKGDRLALIKSVVDNGRPAGILLYKGNEPIGWCAVAPYDDYPTLVRSRVSYPIDNTPSWCISCLFVKAGNRRQGLMQSLIEAGAEYALSNGAICVVGYPRSAGELEGFVERFVGVEGSFRRAGFDSVEHRGPHRIAMRKMKPAS